MKKTLISIITVVKNQQKDFDITAESIASQTFPDFEWIIQDASENKLFLNKKNLKNIRNYHYKDNDINLYDGMNKAVEKSSGMALIFLNAGDYFYSKNALKIIAHDLKLMKKNCKKFFIIAYSFFDCETKKIKYARDWKQCQGLFSYRTPTCHQATIYSKTCFENNKYRIEFHPVSDQILYMELIKNMKLLNIFFKKSSEIIIKYDKPGISSRKRYLQAYLFYKSRKYTNKNIIIILIICISKVYDYPIIFFRKLKNYLLNNLFKRII